MRGINITNFIAGRMEACIGGEWRAVCHDGWTAATATTVCRTHLGFPASKEQHIGQELLSNSVCCTPLEFCTLTCPILQVLLFGPADNHALARVLYLESDNFEHVTVTDAGGVLTTIATAMKMQE